MGPVKPIKYRLFKASTDSCYKLRTWVVLLDLTSMTKGCCQFDSWVRFVLQPSGYEFDDQTLSLDDSIALTVRRPPKPASRQKFWTLVGRWLQTICRQLMWVPEILAWGLTANINRI
jgi:hypothetical protein